MVAGCLGEGNVSNDDREEPAGLDMLPCVRLDRGKQGSIGAVGSQSAIGDTICYLAALEAVAVIRLFSVANEAYSVVGVWAC